MTSNNPKPAILCSTGIVNALIVVIFALMATPLSAQIERQHAAHVHGEAMGSLAVDGSMVSVQLALPGYNLVGFEHPPRTEAQQQRFDQAMNALQQGDWLGFYPDAACVIQSMSATPSGFGGARPLDHQGGDDSGHNHNHDYDHDHDTHAQFELTAVAECGQPEALNWVEVKLFDGFPNNEQIVVDVLTAQSVFQARLAPGAARIEWP